MRGQLRSTGSVIVFIQELIEREQDFVSSVSTLLTIRQGTVHLKRRIGELDGQMGDVGRAVGEKVGVWITSKQQHILIAWKKRALLEQKKVARNMDDAIETLQTCLRLLDLVHRVGEMIREGKYWGALRVHSYSISIWLLITIGVSGRSPASSSSSNIPDPLLRPSSLFPAFLTIVDQRCCDRFHEILAVRCSGEWSKGRKAGAGTDGCANQKMAYEARKGGRCQISQGWRRFGTCE